MNSDIFEVLGFGKEESERFNDFLMSLGKIEEDFKRGEEVKEDKETCKCGNKGKCKKHNQEVEEEINQEVEEKDDFQKIYEDLTENCDLEFIDEIFDGLLNEAISDIENEMSPYDILSQFDDISHCFEIVKTTDFESGKVKESNIVYKLPELNLYVSIINILNKKEKEEYKKEVDLENEFLMIEETKGRNTLSVSIYRF